MEARDSTMDKAQLGIADLIVFTGGVVLSLAIGIFFALKDRKNPTTDNYMFGNKRMPAWAVAFSMAVTVVSALSVVSFPAEVYLFGAVNLWAIVGQLAGIVFTSHYYVPFYCKLQISSVYEYLELRFNRKLRLWMSAILNLQYMIYLGLCIYIPALTLNAVTPVPLLWSIVGTGIVCTVYTTLGGMKAVVWTDVFQGTIIIVGTLSVFIQLVISVGGFGEIWDAAIRGGRMNVFKMEMDPRVHASLPYVFLGNFLYSTHTSITAQPMVQRYISCKNTKQSQKSIYLKGVIYTVIMITLVLNGLAMYAYYEGCDPVLSKQVKKVDQSIPLLVVKIFSKFPGMSGLFVAAVFCGALSTVSSGINSIAAIVLHDFLLIIYPNATSSTKMNISKLASVSTGIIITFVAYSVIFTKGTIVQFAMIMYGAILGPGLAAYLYVFMPIVNVKGAVTSIIGGMSFGVWIAAGKQKYTVSPLMEQRLSVSIEACGNSTENLFNQTAHPTTTFANNGQPVLATTLYALSPFLIGFVGTLFTLTLGLVVSVLTGGNDCSKLNPDLFIPLISDKRLPSTIRKFFRFGVPEKCENKCTSISDYKEEVLITNEIF